MAGPRSRRDLSRRDGRGRGGRRGERPRAGCRGCGPLDMRRDPDDGGPTAAEILRDTREKDLADLFYRFGEERFSRRIARAVVGRRKREPIRATTGAGG